MIVTDEFLRKNNLKFDSDISVAPANVALGHKPKYETFIEDGRVHFRVGAQGFTLDYEGDEDDLEASLDWMREMLQRALDRLAKGGTQ